MGVRYVFELQTAATAKAPSLTHPVRGHFYGKPVHGAQVVQQLSRGCAQISGGVAACGSRPGDIDGVVLVRPICVHVFRQGATGVFFDLGKRFLVGSLPKFVHVFQATHGGLPLTTKKPQANSSLPGVSVPSKGRGD